MSAFRLKLRSPLIFHPNFRVSVRRKVWRKLRLGISNVLESNTWIAYICNGHKYTKTEI